MSSEPSNVGSREGARPAAPSSGFAKAFTVVGIVLLIELALQFYLIATAALHVWGSADNSRAIYAGFKSGDTFAFLHALNGTFVIPITILVLLALAFAGRLANRTKAFTAVLFGLMVIQFLLPWLSGGADFLVAVSGLHGLVAVVITALTFQLVTRNWHLGVGPPAV